VLVLSLNSVAARLPLWLVFVLGLGSFVACLPLWLDFVRGLGQFAAFLFAAGGILLMGIAGATGGRRHWEGS
jgi:hypothetical protein